MFSMFHHRDITTLANLPKNKSKNSATEVPKDVIAQTNAVTNSSDSLPPSNIAADTHSEFLFVSRP